jgi:hypothetical protein
VREPAAVQVLPRQRYISVCLLSLPYRWAHCVFLDAALAHIATRLTYGGETTRLWRQQQLAAAEQVSRVWLLPHNAEGGDGAARG